MGTLHFDLVAIGRPALAISSDLNERGLSGVRLSEIGGSI